MEKRLHEEKGLDSITLVLIISFVAMTPCEMRLGNLGTDFLTDVLFASLFPFNQRTAKLS